MEILGKLELAEASYKRAIALKPNFAEAHNNLGNTLNNLGNLQEAEASFKYAIKLEPNYAEAYNNLGNTLKDLGKLQEAEASFKYAIKLEPNNAEPHSNLGIVLEKHGKFEEAETSNRKAIELNPNSAKAHNNLGVVLEKFGRIEQAEASYKQAIELEPNYAEAYNNLGNTLKDLGKLQEAEANYKQAIKLKPDYAESHSNLANTLKKLGKLQEAEANYKQAIKLKPDFDIAKHHLAALTGETTNSAPRAYVEDLFDNYASKFDNSLVGNLKYKVPKVISELILKKNSGSLLGSVLDLGCGTGLIGLEIKQFCSSLEGLDLSNLMVQEARKKNVYDKLTHRDIVDYLSTENLNFDYFIATDVFIYIGDLSDIFQLVKSRNKSGGKLVFSTEHTNTDGFVLEKTGRYSHSKKYIENMCEKFNYKLSHFESVNLRKEKNQFIIGGLYILEF